MARMVQERRVVLVDSITEITAGDVGAIVVSGSHGGRSAAGFAAAQKAIIYVFNDAGIGKDEAGIAGLDDLERLGQAACCVAASSARIGEAYDTWANGIISAANPKALGAGFCVGARVADCVAACAH